MMLITRTGYQEIERHVHVIVAGPSGVRDFNHDFGLCSDPLYTRVVLVVYKYRIYELRCKAERSFI
jgi:hypothetical protein